MPENDKITFENRPEKQDRLDLKGEFILALLPTVIVLVVLGFVETLNRQQLLFSSLAASAFLIYLDPEHSTNNVRTLTIAQLSSAVTGLLVYMALGSGYLSGGFSMVITIIIMILSKAVHPPAVSTSLSFALRGRDESNLVIFALAVMITVVLVLLVRYSLWVLKKFRPHKNL